MADRGRVPPAAMVAAAGLSQVKGRGDPLPAETMAEIAEQGAARRTAQIVDETIYGGEADRRVFKSREGREVHDPEVHYLGTRRTLLDPRGTSGRRAAIFRSPDGQLSGGDHDRAKRRGDRERDERSQLGNLR
ncbi:hypothetical protein ACPA54_35235 [Uniformispora flossi]|uniref:hypothetical protein n=1 Tax=Uniformispora flossi TaxID=3390723 RepID=UPI003C2F439D